MRRRRRQVRRGRAAVLALLALAGGAARAEGFGARLEESYSHVSSRATDQSGAVSESESTQLLQRARGSFDRAFFPNLRFDADGLYEWNLGWITQEGGPTADLDSRRWNLGSRLALGDQFLGGGLSAARSDQWSEQRLAGDTLRSPRLIRETLGAYAGWKPAELPTLDIRAGRAHQYDSGRALIDTVSDDLSLASAFRPARPLDLRYSVRWGRGSDRLHGVDTSDVAQGATGTWADTFLQGRVSGYASYNIGTRTGRTTVTGSGGVVLTQVIPTAGLSLVEKALDTPDRARLVSNPRLIDGDTGSGDGGTGSSAGLDLGTAPSASGDVAYRDMGAQFPDLLHPVNTIHVWVNKPLPADVAATFLWTVWRSDDNQTWTQLGSASAAPFGLFQPRFEIPIPQATARYLKVTVRPLAVAATTDPRFASILVTEIQFFLSESAVEVSARGSPTVTSGVLSANGRAMLVPAVNLAYDTSLAYTHSDHPWKSTWSLGNGLSAARRLGPMVGTGARIERTDSDVGQGRESALRWSASVTADPLPTLGGGVAYAGQRSERRTGVTRSQSLTAFSRADLYPGLAAFASAGGTLGRAESGRDTEGLNLSAGATIAPNRTLALNTSYSRSISTSSGGGQPTSHDDRSQVEGSGSWSPFPALSMSGSVSRNLTGPRPSTLASFSGAFSPFPGGQLVTRFFYSQTLDTSSDVRTRVQGAGARWNVRSGLSLDTTYTVSETRSPAQELVSRIFFATLSLALL